MTSKDILLACMFIINGGRNSYDPVEILAKKTKEIERDQYTSNNHSRITKIIVGSKLPIEIQINFTP